MQSLCTHPLPCTLLAVIGRLKSTRNIEYIKEKTIQKFNKHANTHSTHTHAIHMHIYSNLNLWEVWKPSSTETSMELYRMLLCYCYNSPSSGWSVNTVLHDSQWVPHNHCFCWDIKTEHCMPVQDNNTTAEFGTIWCMQPWPSFLG